MSKTIYMPLRHGIPFRDQCSHGKLWTEDCTACEIVSLEEWLEKMEPQIERDRARLNRLLAASPEPTAGESK